MHTDNTMSLLRTKVVNADHSNSNGSQLRQVLSALDLTLLGIGAGILVLTGGGAVLRAGGPGLCLRRAGLCRPSWRQQWEAVAAPRATPTRGWARSLPGSSAGT